MTLFTAVSDTYVPLLATSEIQLGRELTLIPKKPKKKKKKKKKKKNKIDQAKEKKAFYKDKDNKPGSSHSKSSSTRSEESVFAQKDVDISRRPVGLQQVFVRNQDRIFGRSNLRSLQRKRTKKEKREKEKKKKRGIHRVD